MRYFPFFFFNDTATTEIYTLSLHDALPISHDRRRQPGNGWHSCRHELGRHADRRSEEHTSELQSHSDLVCRLLLEKKKKFHNHLNGYINDGKLRRMSHRTERKPHECEHVER